MNLPTRIQLTILLLIGLMLPSCGEMGIYSLGPQGSDDGRATSEPQVSIGVGISVGEARRMAVCHSLTGRRG